MFAVPLENVPLRGVRLGRYRKDEYADRDAGGELGNRFGLLNNSMMSPA